MLEGIVNIDISLQIISLNYFHFQRNRRNLPHCMRDVCLLSWESEDRPALSPTRLPPNKIHYSYPNSGESIGINLDKDVFLTFAMNSMDNTEYRLLNGARKDSIR